MEDCSEDYCPKCGSSLWGSEVIPGQDRRGFFRREIHIYDDIKETTAAYQCPDFNHQWVWRESEGISTARK